MTITFDHALTAFATLGAVPFLCGMIAAATALFSSMLGRDAMPPAVAKVTQLAVELPGMTGAAMGFIALSPIWVAHRMASLLREHGGDE